MTAPQPGTPEYNKHLRDQNQQVNTEDLDGDKSWQAGQEYVSTAPVGTPQTPTTFPTGEDTELNTKDE